MTKSPNPTDVHVGQRVRLRRMMQGLSQTDLGTDLGITFQQVQKYEKGVNRIGASRLQRIGQILQVPVEFFFEGAPGAVAGAPGPVAGADIVAQMLTAPHGLALAQAFLAIDSARHRAALVLIAEGLAGQPERLRSAA